MDPTKQEHLHQQPVGDAWIRPAKVRIRATFSASGATVTVSSTRRQAYPGVGITGSGGTYAVAGLPQGADYHPVGVALNPGTGTKLINQANVSAFDAGAGTLTFLTRRSDTGAVAAPADDTVVYITLDVETGIYS